MPIEIKELVIKTVIDNRYNIPEDEDGAEKQGGDPCDTIDHKAEFLKILPHLKDRIVDECMQEIMERLRYLRDR